MWKCPKCKGGDLDVSVEVWARLIQDEDGENFSTDTDGSQNGGDHEWDSNSVMQCRNADCGYTAISGEFNTEDWGDEN